MHPGQSYRVTVGLPVRASARPEQPATLTRSPDPGSDQRSRAHQALRDATAAAHRTLDHHPLLQRLTGSELTREQYAESLAAMYVPHVRLERLVHDSGHHRASGLGLATRSHLLDADLAELGWPDLPVSSILLEPLEQRAAWWGRVYVLEGSRLGGVAIARRIRASLGADVPCRFFGDAPALDHHRALHGRLAHALAAPDQLDRACASARAAFADYHAGLDAWGRADAPSSIGRAA